MTDATLSMKHLNMLRDAGVTKIQISEVTGLGVATLERIMNGKNRSNVVFKETEKKILEVKVTDFLPQGYRDIRTYQRKLRALIAIGWSKRELAEQMGMKISSVTEIVSERHKYVLGETAKKIDDIYEKLSMTIGTCQFSKNLAVRKRWLPPLAWDDIEDLKESPSYRDVVHTSLTQKKRKSRRTPTKAQMSANADTSSIAVEPSSRIAV